MSTVERPPISPTGAGARGTVAGLIGAAAVAAVTGQVGPELATAVGAVTVGLLVGLGTEARNVAATGAKGVKGFFGRIFSFLG